jgi:hypothetical protein
LEDLGTNRKILKWVKKNRVTGYGLDTSVSRQGAGADSTENSSEPLQRISQLAMKPSTLKKDSVLWSELAG